LRNKLVRFQSNGGKITRPTLTKSVVFARLARERTRVHERVRKIR